MSVKTVQGRMVGGERAESPVSIARTGGRAFSGLDFAVRWPVSAGALKRGAAAMLNGHASSLVGAELVWQVRGSDRTVVVRAELILRCRGSAPEVRMLHDGPGEVEVDGANGLVHVRSEGRLALTVGMNDSGVPTVLRYAATTLWSGLGLSGGTYDSPVLGVP